ncbi:hypothetical protein [Rhizobium mesoamericanum]|uniref:Transmembrane protein n=1 Tax=Rhizobium mesoamericanum STM3625 TaxID=1211777 RepID=K0PYV4_9HYPH|nr:hypothetical protein [Rhizobium mesoamericanum]CCM79163.1 membrane hypothetical protein [Rhizobium mesoamericanum STM3625]
MDLQKTACPTALWRPAFVSLLLTMLLLTPALINGFPLVMDDSIAYSGQGVGWIRSNTAAVLIALPYRFVGYWALPMFNAVLTATAWLLFYRGFSPTAPLVLALPLAVLSLQPLYASAVLVDSWFFSAIAFLIVAIRWKSPFLAMLSGILLSGHASGLLLVLPFSLLATLAFRNLRMLAMPGLAIATLLLVNTALEHKYFPDVPRLGQTFLASRLFSIHPELLTRQCGGSGDTTLCAAADFMAQLQKDPINAGRRDFFWDIARQFPQGFQLDRFERQHARPIIMDGLTYEPMKTAAVIAADLLSFYAPKTTLDFIPVLTERMPEGFYQSAQPQGLWQTEAVRGLCTALRYTLYIVTIVALLRGWQWLSREERIWTVLLLLLSFGNDLLFAIISGPPDRYHHRILPLLSLIALIAIGAIRRGRAIVASKHQRLGDDLGYIGSQH